MAEGETISFNAPYSDAQDNIYRTVNVTIPSGYSFGHIALINTVNGHIYVTRASFDSSASQIKYRTQFSFNYNGADKVMVYYTLKRN